MTTLITREQLLELVNAQRAVVIDALPSAYFEQVHIPGALNLVESDVDALAPGLLPDRDALIVTYCSNTACPNSAAVARRLESLGYRNVGKYAEGIQDWVAAGLPTESGPARRSVSGLSPAGRRRDE